MGADDVCVEVHGAGVNPVDIKIRNGELKAARHDRLPITLGCELSGVIVERGANVSRFRAGDAVIARVQKARLGAFAELALVDHRLVAMKPPTLDHFQAAALPNAGLTAYQALRQHGRLERGQKVLIHGGGGAVGSIAIQLAKHWGAMVATTVGEKDRDYAASIGADEVFDYRRDSFEKSLRDYDLVLDTVGGSTLARSFQVLRRGGAIVSIAGRPTTAFARAIGVPRPLVWILALLNRRVVSLAAKRDVTRSFFMVEPDGEQLAELAGLAARNIVSVRIDSVFALDAAASAFDRVESRGARGKVILDPRSSAATVRSRARSFLQCRRDS
jgi:NADPH:quinone reductase-like Zn-dependent oxidoreductase